MPNGTEVGDAVLNFRANTTELEAAYDKVDKTPQRLEPARRAIEDVGHEFHTTSTGAKELGEVSDLAGEKVKFSMYEAKGEIGLLGEAFGVHLPRHVRSFVAELPGVGAAMTAAFSATAVLFVIQSVVELTKKITEFGIEAIYNSKNNEELEATTKALNGQLLVLSKTYEELKKRADDYGKSALQLANQGKAEVKQSIEDLNKELKKEEEELKALDEAAKTHTRTRLGLMEAYTMARTGQISYLEAITAVTVGEKASVLSAHKVAEAQNAIILTGQKLKVSHQQLRVSTDQVRKAQEDLDKQYHKSADEMFKATQKLIDELDKYERNLNKGVEAVEGTIDVLPPLVKEILKTAEAFRTLGVVTVGTYEEQKRAAIAAYDTIYAAERKGLASSNDLLRARQRLVAIEITLAKARGVSTAALDSEMRELKKMLGETEQYGKVSKQVADQVGHAVTQTAFAYGQGAITISQAMRQTTSVIISEIAKQAEVKGADALAAAFNDFGHYDFAAGAHHMAAAGAWFALAGGVSAAAGAVAGSSATPGTAANPTNVTGTQRSSGTTSAPRAIGATSSLQSFANGGLITQPVMAMLGDRPSSKGEVAFDLDDKRSIMAIREAMGGGSGGGDIHVHVAGLIDGQNLGKVIGKISKRVRAGHSFLHSSNSGRVTKRSV